VLAGKYKLVRVVGEGGMGVVYECEHIRMRQRMAIKMLLPDTVDHPDVIARFEREARASSGLRSRHAARVTDVDQTPDGLTYMVMEFLDGMDLGDLLAERGKVPAPDAVDYVLQACVAIIEAHDLGIVHRDLKPGNLFLANGPDGRIIKLLDFGISKVTDDASRLTTAESMMGTPLYMSPEQIRSARDVDARTDIWSLGVILYELLTGDVPFNGTTTQVAAAIVTDLVPPMGSEHGVPPGLSSVVMGALVKDPNARFQSVRELGAALLPFAAPSSTGVVAMDAALRQSQGPLSAAAPGAALPRTAATQHPATLVDPPRRTHVIAILGGILLGVAVLTGIGVAVALKARATRPDARPDPSLGVSTQPSAATLLATVSAPSSTTAASPTTSSLVVEGPVPATSASSGPTSVSSTGRPVTSSRGPKGAGSAPSTQGGTQGNTRVPTATPAATPAASVELPPHL
jgi:serine/threonine-protein kinase